MTFLEETILLMFIVLFVHSLLLWPCTACLHVSAALLELLIAVGLGSRFAQRFGKPTAAGQLSLPVSGLVSGLAAGAHRVLLCTLRTSTGLLSCSGFLAIFRAYIGFYIQG